MHDLLLPLHDSTQPLPSTPPKKKYSKVNDALKTRFLEFIVQENMSIKEASLALNINYSSAKAILSAHRKTVIHAHKKTNKHCRRAEFRPLCPLESFLNPISEFVCTTGGREVVRMETTLKARCVQRTPIILMGAGKELDYMENTSNSQ